MTPEPFAFAPFHTAVRPLKLGERVARRIVDVIVTSGLTPGTRLPIESELVAQLGVGKHTLREALRLLEAWGVIEIKQGRNGGPEVRMPRPQDLREALTVQLLFSSATLQDVIETRCCIEPQSAMVAAERMSADDIGVLRQSVIRMRENAESHTDFLRENQLFHEYITASTQNVVMQAFIDTLKSVMDGSAAGIQYKPARRLAVADAHERIVLAIESRDPQRAHEEMEAHLREAGDFWETSGTIVSRRVPWGT